MSSLRAGPNLTPMIDVMLVLLLIFMIQQLIIPVLALPSTRNSLDKPKPNAVTLRIDRRGVFELSTDSEYGGKGRRVERAALSRRTRCRWRARTHRDGRSVASRRWAWACPGNSWCSAARAPE